MRRVPLLAGVGALLVGVALFVVPPAAVPTFGRVAVSVLGVVAVLLALHAVQTRRETAVGGAETPDPEERGPVPAPGDDPTDTLAYFTHSRPVGSVVVGYDLFRRGLRAAAVTVLVRSGRYDESEATRRVLRGEWTDDRYAAAFLADETGVGSRVGGLFADPDRGVRRAVAEVVAAADVLPETDAAWTAEASAVVGRSVRSLATRAERSLPVGTRPTKRWTGVSVAAFLAVGLGVLGGAPAVVLAAVVGVAVAVYAGRSAPAEPSLAVERTLATDAARPGEAVSVTVTVRNEGDHTLYDARFFDGVPDALAVDEGRARHGAVLRPGDATTFTYAVTASRGAHEFGPVFAVVRDLAGTTEVATTVAAPDPGSFTCVPPLRAAEASVPVREATTPYVGSVPTDTGGDGVEFFGVRDYRAGDPLSRIDWARHARTGEFHTVEYRQERSAAVVVVVDARPRAYLAPAPDDPSAVERTVDAARRVVPSLLDRSNRVGLAALDAPDCYVPPGGGDAHRTRLRETLALHPALAPIPDEERRASVSWERRLRERVPAGSQVVLCSPLPDQRAAGVARRLDALGYPVTVVSPDPTVADSPGHQLARLGRALRMADLRAAGVPVVDWGWAEPLAVALARHGRRHRRVSP